MLHYGDRTYPRESLCIVHVIFTNKFLMESCEEIINSMVVADGLVPVWHPVIGRNHDGKYRPVCG